MAEVVFCHVYFITKLPLKNKYTQFLSIAKFPQQDWISFQSSRLTNESACFPTASPIGVTVLLSSCDLLGEKWYLCCYNMHVSTSTEFRYVLM